MWIKTLKKIQTLRKDLCKVEAWKLYKLGNTRYNSFLKKRYLVKQEGFRTVIEKLNNVSQLSWASSPDIAKEYISITRIDYLRHTRGDFITK